MAELPTHALSLKGPWWFFMLCFPKEFRKRIENRPPGFSHKSFRGECWVHATKATRQEYINALVFARRQGVPMHELEAVPPFERMPVGGIVGRFTIVDMLPATPCAGLPGSWRMPDSIGFVVANATPVRFVECKGTLGFWRVPDAVLDQLRRAA
jgi:hypothetical protein